MSYETQLIYRRDQLIAEMLINEKSIGWLTFEINKMRPKTSEERTLFKSLKVDRKAKERIQKSRSKLVKELNKEIKKYRHD